MIRDRLFTLMMTVMLLAGPAMAQQAQQIADAPKEKKLLPTLVGLFLAVAIAVAAFMTPKRGHQD